MIKKPNFKLCSLSHALNEKDFSSENVLKLPSFKQLEGIISSLIIPVIELDSSYEENIHPASSAKYSLVVEDGPTHKDQDVTVDGISKNDSLKKPNTKEEVVRSETKKVSLIKKVPKTKPHLISFVNERNSDEQGYLSSRCDVVYKTILRNFRRNYQIMFRKRPNVTYKASIPLLIDEIKNFAMDIWKTDFDCKVDADELEFNLGCLVYPKYMLALKDSFSQLTKTDAEERKRKIRIIHDSLYCFNIKKAMNLMKNNIIYTLFCVYQSKIQSGELEIPKIMMKNRSAYEVGFRNLICEGKKAKKQN